MENNLPKGWEVKKLVDYVPIIKTGVERFDGEKPYYSTGSISDKEMIPEGKFTFKNRPARANRLVLEKDVVQARMRETQKAVLVGKELKDSLLSTGFLQFRPEDNGYNSRLFYYYLRSDRFLKQRDEYATGSTQVALTDEGAEKIDLVIPPREQQKSIADKLDILLTRVKDVQSRLDKIPTILGRFRQSILAAAFSGELTKAWRAENARFNATEDLIFIKDFILKSEITNRERIIFEEINKISLDSYEDQFVAPSSWKVCCIGLIGLVNNGSTPSRKVAGYWNGAIPWVSSGEVQNNVISESREKITQNGLDNCSSKLFPTGTVLIAMIGEGKTRGQSSILNLNAAINQNIAAVQIAHGRINPEYLWYWFRYQYENNRNYGSGSGPQALNCQRVRELPFVLAPKVEQDKIVEKIKSSFEMLNAFIERYRKSKDYINKLEQSILAKAFRGELVTQGR
jgi:type I restriction enzyme S subunit